MSSKAKKQQAAAVALKQEIEQKKYGNPDDDNGYRACTGVLTTRYSSKDVKIEQFTLGAYGREIIMETEVEFNQGARYGLIGRNGSGKSTFMKAVAAREIPIPDHIDIFFLSEEAPKSDFDPIGFVVDEANKEVARLEIEAENSMETHGPESELCQLLYARLDELEPDTFQEKAGRILHGLGFDQEMLKKPTKDMSGGWRMRVALARALFVKPALLLLDEPTNHLDLEACVWLEQYLAQYDRCLVVVSHSQDFLNGVCTDIIHLTPKQSFQYYSGNYDQFIQTKQELEVNQMKRFNKEQEDIKHLKQFIASCGTYANLVRQAKSKQKIIDKMEEKGLTEKVLDEFSFQITFKNCGKLPPPAIAFNKVAFSYPNGKEIYKCVNVGVHSDSRVALVGPNGTGKSTLLKLMMGHLQPTQGEVKRHTNARIGYFNQHSTDILDMEATPLDFMRKFFAEENLEEQAWRTQLGRYGLSGKEQTLAIKKLSDGQKSRLVIAVMAYQNPNMLLLDEPTNHLDIETIDALAGAINAFDGGLVLVSHDFRLIEQVATEVWVCDKKTITVWNGSIRSYKNHLIKHMVV